MSVQEQIMLEVRQLSDTDARLLLERIKHFRTERRSRRENALNDTIVDHRYRYLERMDAILLPSGRSAEEIDHYIRESRDYDRF